MEGKLYHAPVGASGGQRRPAGETGYSFRGFLGVLDFLSVEFRSTGHGLCPHNYPMGFNILVADREILRYKLCQDQLQICGQRPGLPKAGTGNGGLDKIVPCTILDAVLPNAPVRLGGRAAGALKQERCATEGSRDCSVPHFRGEMVAVAARFFLTDNRMTVISRGSLRGSHKDG